MLILIDLKKKKIVHFKMHFYVHAGILLFYIMHHLLLSQCPDVSSMG